MQPRKMNITKTHRSHKHGLKWRVFSSTRFCDVCGKRGRGGYWNCKGCDWDACDDCISTSALDGTVLKTTKIGARVRRGPDWKWKHQDKGGKGTTVDGCKQDGWVKVKWDHDGSDNNYRVGGEDCYDLEELA